MPPDQGLSLQYRFADVIGRDVIPCHFIDNLFVDQINTELSHDLVQEPGMKITPLPYLPEVQHVRVKSPE